MPFPFMAAAIGGSALIGAGASIFGSSKASDAQEAGAAAAAKAQRQALQQQWKMYQQGRADYAPWREAGEGALGRLEGAIEAGPGEFIPEEQPGYKFGWQEFIERPYTQAQSAKGKRLSGETMRGLTKYAQDYASTSYDNFLNRYYQSLTPDQSMAGMGMTGAAGQAGAAQQYGQAAGQHGANMANLQYQNALAQGSYQTQMGAGVAGAAQGGMNSYMDYMMAQKLGAGGGAGSIGGGGTGNFSYNSPYFGTIGE
ncbi:MAG: hypothetical protein GY861_02785 [bacterium]|nr:hypothetical protein [bacterium]